MFTVKRNSVYTDVKFSYDNTEIDMGMHCKEERARLAEDLLSTVYELLCHDFYDVEDLHKFVLEQL